MKTSFGTEGWRVPDVSSEFSSSHQLVASLHDLLQAVVLPKKQQWLREFQSLAEEKHPEIFSANLFSFISRLEQAGELGLAAQVLAQMRANPTLALRAGQELQGLLSQGRSGKHWEMTLRHVTQEATNPVALASLGAASAVFGVTRLATLTRLNRTPGRFFGAQGARRAAANLLAFGAEGLTLPLVSRLSAQAFGTQHPGTDFGRELASTYFLLGAMRLTGAAPRALIQGRFPRVESLLRQPAMFGGILLAQGGEGNFSDAVARLLQFNVAGHLASRILGARFRYLQNRLDFHYENAAPTRSPFPWAGAMPALAGNVSQNSRALTERPLAEHLNIQMAKGGEGSAGPYREEGNPFGSKENAVKEYQETLKTLRDKQEDPDRRVRRLAELPEFLRYLNNQEAFRGLQEVFPLMSASALSRPKSDSPRDMQAHPEEIPPLILEFYTREWDVRKHATQHFVHLLPLIWLQEQAEVSQWLTRVRNAILSPNIPTYFKPIPKPWPFNGDSYLRNVYRDAEFSVRRELVKAYLALLPRLKGGEDEVLAAAKMLSDDRLLDPLSEGLEHGIIDGANWLYLLNLTKIYALLRTFMPPTIFEMQQAWLTLRKTVEYVRREAESDPEALKALILLAFTEPDSRAVLKTLAEKEIPGAEEGVRQIETRLEIIRGKFGKDFRKVPYRDGRVLDLADLVGLGLIKELDQWLGKKSAEPEKKADEKDPEES